MLRDLQLSAASVQFDTSVPNDQIRGCILNTFPCVTVKDIIVVCCMLYVRIPYSLLTHEETACEKLQLRTYAHFHQVVRILSSIMDSINMYIYVHISESVIHI